MRIIPQSMEVLDRRDMTNMEKIESAGRLAYKSEGEIVSGSAKGFVKKIRKCGHESVMEFAVVHILIHSSEQDISKFLASLRGIDKYMAIDCFQVKGTTANTITTLITGTVRAWSDLLMAAPRNNAVVDTIGWFLENELPDEFPTKHFSLEVSEGDTVLVSLEGPDYIKEMPYDIRMRHFHIAVKFITNRAISHKLLQHRPCSAVEESQRYCNYNLEQFEKSVTFVEPTPFFGRGTNEWDIWEGACQDSETKYLALISRGATPQAARTVLHNSCKTEIILFASLVQWGHIFSHRTVSGEDPSMQQAMKPVQKEVIANHHLYE